MECEYTVTMAVILVPDLVTKSGPWNGDQPARSNLEAVMQFSKAASMWVLLVTVLEAVAICVVCYVVGGYSHAVPQ
jgi:hypothetical protein